SDDESEPAPDAAPAASTTGNGSVPHAIWPGIENLSDAAALDDLRARCRAVLRVIRGFYREFADDPWRIRGVWSASEAFRAQSAALLLASSPRAIGDCDECQGRGGVAGRLCDSCGGTGCLMAS